MQQGYQVEVICFEFDNWSYEINQQIKEELKGAKLHIIQAGRKPFLPWAGSVFLEKCCRIIGRIIPLHGWMLSQSVSRRSILLLREIKRIPGSKGLVVGHNPGALYPTYFAGKRLKAKTGFDVEDYHPGETNDIEASGRIKKLLNSFLPKMKFLTFASAPIRNEVKINTDVKGEVIMNWFPAHEFQNPVVQTGKIKLVWFSQNISFNRGLEIVIPIIEKLYDVELHLFGNCNAKFQSMYLMDLNNVFLHPALSQKELHHRMCEFDCGLAVEPKKDLNNDLALSNKLLAYFQAGLFLIASETIGQKQFLQMHNAHGIIINLYSHLNESIQKIISMKAKIRIKVRERYCTACENSWENEAEKILKIWNEVDSP